MFVASQAVVLLLRKYDSNCDTEIDAIAERKEVFLQNAFTTLNSLLSHGYLLIANHGKNSVVLIAHPLPRLVRLSLMKLVACLYFKMICARFLGFELSQSRDILEL